MYFSKLESGSGYSRPLCQSGGVPTSIDFTALTAPLPTGQSPQLVTVPGVVSRPRILTGLALLFLGVISAFGGLGGVVGVMRNASDGLTPYSNVIAPTAVGAASVVVLVIGLRLLTEASRGAKHESMSPRLEAFAAANGLLYSDATASPAYPGAIFTLDNAVDRRAVRHLRSTAGRFFDFGEYVARIAVDSSTPFTRSWGFIAIALDRRLPHMMLMSKFDNRHSTALPDDLRDRQTLSLEGDFDAWFTLYAPEQYQRDALYFFTPDLMALFIDEAAPFDAEIVDEWLFIYSNAPFTSLGAEVYERVFRIIELVGAKAVKQSTNYADDRVGDRSANIIAPPGRRLRRTPALTLLRGLLLLACLAAAVVAIFYGISLLPGTKVL